MKQARIDAVPPLNVTNVTYEPGESRTVRDVRDRWRRPPPQAKGSTPWPTPPPKPPITTPDPASASRSEPPQVREEERTVSLVSAMRARSSPDGRNGRTDHGRDRSPPASRASAGRSWSSVTPNARPWPAASLTRTFVRGPGWDRTIDQGIMSRATNVQYVHVLRLCLVGVSTTSTESTPPTVWR